VDIFLFLTQRYTKDNTKVLKGIHRYIKDSRLKI